MLVLVIAGIRFAQPSACELAAGRDVRPQPYGGHPTPLSAPEIPGIALAKCGWILKKGAVMVGLPASTLMVCKDGLAGLFK